MSHLEPLITLALQRNILKYPSLPDKIRVIHKYTDKTANGLTRCICDFLNFSGFQAERISNSGRWLDNRQTYTDVIGITRTIGSGQWIPGTGTPGTADISATIKGRSVKIEVKIGKDKQSPKQKQYQQSIERSGGVYMIATSFSQFHQWFINFVK